MITFQNYFLNTKGTFTYVGDIKEFYTSSKWGIKINPQYYFKNELAKLLKIDSKELKHNHTSFNRFLKSGSVYFEIKGTTKLIRISDHWSKAINLNWINQCGEIRSCWWELKGENQSTETPYQIGIIDLKDLEMRD